MKLKKLSALLLAGTMCVSIAACSGGDGTTTPAPSTAPESSAPATTAGTSDLSVAVFYYNYSDAFISNVRNEMDAQWEAMGVTYNNYDGNTNQGTQMDQVNTAIANGANVLVVNAVEASADETTQSIVDAAKTAGIPVIFFNREVSDDVVNSYDLAAFVGTDPAEAGHMQGELIGNYLIENYDAVDLNGDGVISYVMFKGQENNPEAEMRTQLTAPSPTSCSRARRTTLRPRCAPSTPWRTPTPSWRPTASPLWPTMTPPPLPSTWLTPTAPGLLPLPRTT